MLVSPYIEGCAPARIHVNILQGQMGIAPKSESVRVIIEMLQAVMLAQRREKFIPAMYSQEIRFQPFRLRPFFHRTVSESRFKTVLYSHRISLNIVWRHMRHAGGLPVERIVLKFSKSHVNHATGRSILDLFYFYYGRQRIVFPIPIHIEVAKFTPGAIHYVKVGHNFLAPKDKSRSSSVKGEVRHFVE